MFSNYIATNEDFSAIEEALTYVWKQEIEYIFKDKTRIENTVVVSFDSQNIFVWERKDGKYVRTEIRHDIKLTDKDQRGWSTNFKIKEIKGLLPARLRDSIFTFISGSLLQPFIKIQETKPILNNPYTTRESYLSVVVHEFAHSYFNFNQPSYFNDSQVSIEFMLAALRSMDESLMDDVEIQLLPHKNISETFAFCAEYSACRAFWHQQMVLLDVCHKQALKEAIENEKTLNLDSEDSYLNDVHNYSVVMGRLLMKSNPADWPEILQKKIG